MGKIILLFPILYFLFRNISYPPRYVYEQSNQFFISHFKISAVLPTIPNENEYHRLRYLPLNQPSIPEYQTPSRIAKALEKNSRDEVSDPLVRALLEKQSKFNANLVIHYTYEKRLQNNKRDIHRFWNQTFAETPVTNTQLLVGNRNSRNLTRELVHRRPPTFKPTTNRIASSNDPINS